MNFNSLILVHLISQKSFKIVSNLFSFKKRGVSTINLGLVYFSKRGKINNKVGSIFHTKYSLFIHHLKTFSKSWDSTDFKPKKYWRTPKLWSSEIFKISPFTLNFFQWGTLCLCTIICFVSEKISCSNRFGKELSRATLDFKEFS